MPKYLAIEWDDHQLRALVATTSGRSVTIEEAGAIDLPTEEGKDPPPEMIGKALAGWVREKGLSRCTTLVAVGRASIELRRLSLPPAPDDELPEMVRFQAQREFTSLSEESPLDFLPLAGDATTPRQVLAAALSPDLLAQIRSVCDAAGLKAERIVLRPCATAAVVRQSSAKGEENTATLVVDPLLDELDLSVLVGEKVVFIRTLRLPHVAEDEKQFRPLLGELRRTMAAFHNQFHDVRISSITVCGDPGERAALVGAIEQEFSLTTTVLHPMEVVGGTSRFKKHMPEHPGRFAPLVGMVIDEAAGSHAIDFLNPRKKPEQKTNRRTYILAAAAAAVMLLSYAWWQYSRIAEKRVAVEGLQREIQEIQNNLRDEWAPIQARATVVDGWLVNDINWLDELYEASKALRPKELTAKDFPVNDDVLVTKAEMKVVNEGGQIILDVAAKRRELATEIPGRVETESGHVLTVDNTVEQNSSTREYPWTFKATVHVKSPAADQSGG